MFGGMGAATTKFALLLRGTSCSSVDRYYSIGGTAGCLSWTDDVFPNPECTCRSLWFVHSVHFLHQHTQFIYQPKAVLISTSIKRVSATCFGTCVPSLGKTQRHSLKTKRFCEAVIYRFLGSVAVARGGAVVEALRYKPEDCGFDSRWHHWIYSLI
jgi:hypothetical protein